MDWGLLQVVALNETQKYFLITKAALESGKNFFRVLGEGA